MYKIAICDDDKNYREKIEKVIETEGILPKSEIRFYEYESGKELLKNADILHDLVFMDMRMPGLDGNKSVLKLREYNRAAILVFCSGYFGSSAIIRYYCYIPCTSTLLQATACHIFHTLYVLSFLICY